MIDWLASYPKSGNTWMRLLLANYYSEVDDPHDINRPGITNGIASHRWRFDEVLGIDSSDLTDSEIADLQPRLYEAIAALNPARQWIKVHDAQSRIADGGWLFPPKASGVVIYLVRNPLDVAVSRAFHDGHGDMDRAIGLLCDPQGAVSGGGKLQLRQFMGDWSHNVRSWLDQDEIPVLTVRYEDLLADTSRELSRVIAFARPDDPIDPTRIAQAVDYCAFANLQAAEAAAGFREATPRQKRFFRSGKAGDWIDHLTPAQANRIRQCHGATMRRLGYDA